MSEEDPPRPAHLPPGFDEDSPYNAGKLDDHPDWWTQNIKVFREHEMRPYRPPRLSDGTVTTNIIDRLETTYDVDIRIRAVDPQDGGSWKILVDGEVATSVEHTRTESGNTRYELTAEDFEESITEAIEE